MIMHYKKCKVCPYYLGIIKCIVSPCPKCIASKRSTPPFPEPIIKNTKPKK